MFYIIFFRQLFGQKFYRNFSQNYGSLPTFPVLKNSDRNLSCSCLSLCTLRLHILEKTLPHTWKYERVTLLVFNEMSTNCHQRTDGFGIIHDKNPISSIKYQKSNSADWIFFSLIIPMLSVLLEFGSGISQTKAAGFIDQK